MNIDHLMTLISSLLKENRAIAFLLILVIWSLWNWASKKISHTEDNPFSDLPIKLAKEPIKSLLDLFKQISSDYTKDIDISKSTGVLIQVTQEFSNYTSRVSDRLGNHVKTIIQIVGGHHPKDSDRSITSWRVAGGILSFILLVLFLYTDLVQSVNNVGILFPKEIESFPEWSKHLGYSIVMSSAGMIFTLSFIMIDALGITHFLPWEGVRLWNPKKTMSLRLIVFIIALLTLIFALFLLTIMALPRALAVQITLPGTEGTTPVRNLSFMSGYAQLISLAAAFAHTLLIFPTLITTALLFWGVMGMIILYGTEIGVLWFFSIIVKGTVYLLSMTIELLKPSGKLFIQSVMIIILTLFVILALIIGTLLIIVENITRAVIAVVELMLFPITIIGDMASSFLRTIKSLRSQNQ